MKPKILLIDIETFPDTVYTWGVYEQNAIRVKRHWYMISFAYKWLGEAKVHCKALPDYSTRNCEDRELCKDIWQLLDEADIVVAHNGEQFDIRKIKARFIAHGMKPPSPYRVVDTKREVVRVAGFSSNKLDWLCQQLDLGRKVEKPDGFEMWFQCAEEDNPKAWARMKKYNTHDITLLEKLYNKLLPWIQQPNYSEGLVCTNPVCGSKTVQLRGYARNKTRTYRRYQCNACGAWSRAVVSEKDKRAMLVGLTGGEWK